MTIKNVPVNFLKVSSLKVSDENGECEISAGRGSNIVAFRFKEDGRPFMVNFFRQLFKRPDWKTRQLDLSLEVHYKRRTLDQNRLYWSLLSVLSYEAKGSHGHEEEIHEEMLQLYAPRVDSALGGPQVPMRSKHMSTVQFATCLLNNVFRELAEHGTQVYKPEDIRAYWMDFYKWRSEQKRDPVQIASFDEYRKAVPYCEACLENTWRTDEDGIYRDQGHIAHIISRGAGGSDDTTNVFHFCAKHHALQHQIGWETFLKQFPHLQWRYDQAHDVASAQPKDD